MLQSDRNRFNDVHCVRICSGLPSGLFESPMGARESLGAKKLRFAPNREALNKIPSRISCAEILCEQCLFCPTCHSVQDRVALDEIPPCPVPWKVWQSLRKIPPNAAPFYAVKLILKLWKRFRTSCRAASLRAAARMASQEN